MKKPPTLEQLQQAVDDWNRDNPPGTPVKRYAIMEPRQGEFTLTETRGTAFVASGHSPVVFVKGFSGWMHLNSLEVVPEHEREKSAIPPVEKCPPPAHAPTPKRSGVFFASDVSNAVDAVLTAAGEHEDPEHFVNAVVAELQRPKA